MNSILSPIMPTGVASAPVLPQEPVVKPADITAAPVAASATDATTSATGATTSATDATTSATEATASATEATASDTSGILSGSSSFFSQAADSLGSYVAKIRPVVGPLLGISVSATGLYVLVKEYPAIRSIISNTGKATSVAARPSSEPGKAASATVHASSSEKVWRTGIRAGLALTAIVTGVLMLNHELPLNRAE